MKNSTHIAIGQAQATSTGTGDVKTLTPPPDTSAALISVETTSARMTFDKSAPAAGNGHVFPTAQVPQMILIGPGSEIRFAATAAANSIVNVTWLR